MIVTYIHLTVTDGWLDRWSTLSTYYFKIWHKPKYMKNNKRSEEKSSPSQSGVFRSRSKSAYKVSGLVGNLVWRWLTNMISDVSIMRIRIKIGIRKIYFNVSVYFFMHYVIVFEKFVGFCWIIWNFICVLGCMETFMFSVNLCWILIYI